MYKMKYIGGGGTEYDGGIWEIKETPKTITFKIVKKPFFSTNMPECRISKTRERSHCLSSYETGIEYIVYPFQNGKPHIFEVIHSAIIK